MKKALFSNKRDPENRSKKWCVCGFHSVKAKKKHKPRQGGWIAKMRAFSSIGRAPAS